MDKHHKHALITNCAITAAENRRVGSVHTLPMQWKHSLSLNLSLIFLAHSLACSRQRTALECWPLRKEMLPRLKFARYRSSSSWLLLCMTKMEEDRTINKRDVPDKFFHWDKVQFRIFILSNEDASSDKLAAAFGLPEMITDQTEIEEQTSLHLTNLTPWHCPWS